VVGSFVPKQTDKLGFMCVRKKEMDEEQLTSYEKERLERIQKNQQMLLSLGLKKVR
jgi:hypothetical protein